MIFCELLQDYMQRLDAGDARLAQAAGISISSVTRYRKGEREPGVQSPQLSRLARGLSLLSAEKGKPVPEEEILSSLEGALKNCLSVSYDAWLENLRLLLGTMDIRRGALARALAYDPSHISKVLSGQRRPGDISRFSAEISSYIAQHCTSPAEKTLLCGLLGVNENTLSGMTETRNAVALWLGSNAVSAPRDPVGHFLQKMDDFNLDAFIRTLHFDDTRLPASPRKMPKSGVYEGLDRMMECELDFIRATLLSPSMEDCILYSDMPMEEMADDPEFPKNWMLGMAMLLRKGLHLHIIHDVNRPFAEMMLGLESNILMYMTGQISPYYLPSSQSSVFRHLLKVSGPAAMTGSAITGYQPEGRYILTTSEADVRHFRLQAQRLLKKAQPLMDIYRSSRAKEFEAFLDTIQIKEDRRIISDSLPLYTMTKDLLLSILQRNALSETETREILTFYRKRRLLTEALPEAVRITLVVPDLTPEQFQAAPLNLSLEDIFFEKNIPYTYTEYRKHLAQTADLAASHPGICLERNPSPTFRNISFSIIGDRQVIVSKSSSPAIHFVIHHKKMVQAFCSFTPPIRD